jgi:hypothetical protein
MTEHFIPYDQTKEMIPVRAVWHPNNQFHYVKTNYSDKFYPLEWDKRYSYYRGKIEGEEGYVADASYDS